MTEIEIGQRRFGAQITGKLRQHRANVLQDHVFCFGGHLKRAGIPAPVPVKEDVVREIMLQDLADSGFPDPHRPADDQQFFHVCSPAVSFLQV